MTRSLVLTIATLISLAAAAVATAKPPVKATTAAIPWIDDLDSGLAAAAKARRPVFLVTLWGPGT